MDVIDVGRAVVRFDDGSTRLVSLAVLVAEGRDVRPGDRVMVSIGMALELDDVVSSPHDRSEPAAREATRRSIDEW